jgi:hypothetical protein
MRFPRVRFTVRRMMATVLAVAFSLGAVRWKAEYLDGYTLCYGPHSSLLAPGQRVVTAGDVPAAVAKEVFDGPARWGRWTVRPEPGRPSALDSGTPCVVRVESAWDDDSCYPDRLISVTVLQGQHKGAVKAVARRHLRLLVRR